MGATISGAAIWDVLIVEPDETVRQTLLEIIGQQYTVAERASAAEAREFLQRAEVRLLIIADDLQDLPGLMFLAETRDLWPGMQRILLCADLDADLLVHAMKEGGILHYLTKPLDAEAASKVVHYCLHQRELLDRLTQTQRLLDQASVRAEGAGHAEGAKVLAGAVWQVSFWTSFFLILCFVLVLTGLAAVYLFKTSLGIDFVPDSHLQDLLPFMNRSEEDMPADFEPPE